VNDAVTRGRARDGPARLIIADDHELVRTSLRTLLAHAPDLAVVGEAAEGAEALKLYRRMRPDLLLLDLNMPVIDGLEVTRTVKAESPMTRVVIVTLDAAPSHLLDAVKAGADAYVLKGTSKRELVKAIRGALTGEPLIQPELARYLLDAQTDGHPWLATTDGPLTALELGILKLSADGYTHPEIRRALRLSKLELSVQIRQLLTRLGAGSA
jgi:DNA-binding NarL/FixJ family response regulator